MKPIINDVNKIIYKIYKAKNPILGEIILNWQKIVGIKYSNNTFPLKISNLRDGKQKINILLVEVDNSSISVEMAFQQDVIIERMAVYMGHKAINKIRTIVRL
jgi:hypothetical protein